VTAVVVVIVAFAAGLLVGIAGDRVYLWRSQQIVPRRGASQFAAKHIVDRLDRDLHLSASQRAEVQKIVEQHRVRIDSVWNNVRPQVRVEIDAASSEIERVLTPEQRTKYRELREKSDRRRNR
jgi:hypothetical protein